jgi:general secretion pathway protein G
MVVVVILGILVAVAAPQILDRPDEARITRAKQDIRAIESALEMYKLDNFNYPTTDQGLEALVEKPTSQPEPKNWKQGGYLKSVPTDPWGNKYQYLGPEDSDGQITVLTLGADDRRGGEGQNADITNDDIQ